MVGVAAVETPEHFVHPESIPAMTVWTRLRRVRWLAEPDRHACDHGEQQHGMSKDSCSPTSPLGQALRILQANTSTRALSHGHSTAGFFGKNLSLKRPRISLSRDGLKPFACSAWAENNALQRPTSVAVTSDDRVSHANITAQPSMRVLDRGHGHGYTDAGIPLAVLPKDFGALVERGTRQGERAVNRAVFLGWDIEPAIAASVRRRTTDHDPTVKALRFPGLLYLRAVDQFGFQGSRLMSGLGRPAIVNRGASVRSADELPHAFRAGAMALSLGHDHCASGVFPLEESHQKRERIRLILRRIELQFVTEIHGLHARSIAKSQQKASPPQNAQIREQPSMASGRPLRLALLGASVQPCSPRCHTASSDQAASSSSSSSSSSL